MIRGRSLNLEHVSPANLRSEISRRTAHAVADKVNLLATRRVRHFTRKPDAGFVFTDERPATLLQVISVTDGCFAAGAASSLNSRAGFGSCDSAVDSSIRVDHLVDAGGSAS